MKDEVITLDMEGYRVRFNGRVLSERWTAHDAAAEALRLLQEGYGDITDDGYIIWKPTIRGKPSEPSE